ncbi:hypothetical protein [Blastococcus sp. CT_GayMR16]|nr:hypothetical protein [Blastococcus sp. CT_GayMR16]
MDGDGPDVAPGVPLAQLPTVHAQAATGGLSGKVIVVPTGV